MTADGIKTRPEKKQLMFADGRTVDIQKVIFEVNADKIWRDTKELSQQFERSKQGLQKLWRFVKYKIRYREDPEGYQFIKYPARLWADRAGDCKSFTLFIVSVLQNLGIKYTIRFTSYQKNDRTVTHVYPVAHLDGEDIILDAVWFYFNSEKRYAHKQDHKFSKSMAAIYKVSENVGKVAPRSLEHTLRSCAHATANIPDSVLQNDVTQMTEAQLYSFLGYKKIGGINAAFDTNKAFAAPSFNFDTASVHGFDTEGAVGALFKKKATGKPVNPTGPKPPMAVQPVSTSAPAPKKKAVVKKVLDAAGAKLKEAWAKLTNWLFKGAFQKAAPFFLFTFLKKNVSPAIASRQAKQNKILDFICKVAKIDRAKVDAALRAGIVQQFGKQPEQILNDTAKTTVAGIGAIPIAMILAAVPKVIEIVKKIAAFFKKSTASLPSADAQSASDLDQLAKEAAATGVTKPAGEAQEAGKVVIQPSEAKAPVVNPTAEQKEAESQEPEASSPKSSSSSSPSSAATGESGGNTEGGAASEKPQAASASDAKSKDNTVMYVGVAAVVLFLAMK
jgi:hypothetical protein